VPTPTWLGATAGQPAQAGQINQFLGTHVNQYLYAGVSLAQQATAGSGSAVSNGQYTAQTFVMPAGKTVIGYVQLQLAVTGTPAPLQVSLYADLGGNPTGAALASTLVPREFLTGTAAVQTVPLPVTGLTAGATYHLVTAPVGDASNHYSLSKSNQTSGSQLSSDGITWTGQTYGLMFWIFDQTVGGGQVVATYEDGGARWSSLTYTGALMTHLEEYTAGQTTAGYTASSRTLTYSSANIIGVA
jgi:hypothetical protein